jgi:hypothetical protein
MIDDVARALVGGTAYLVTGAGFSHGATNIEREPIPSTWQLTQALYATYRTGQVPDGVSLGDVFEIAQMRDVGVVEDLLRRKLSVSTEVDTPDAITTFLSLPWERIYTFNLDDLVEVAAGQSGLALTAASARRSVPSPGIKYVHLNGDIEDGVKATFSERQYAERLASSDPWLATMGAELLPATVVYVGTTLRELHLWRAIEARRLDVGVSLDPRPRSYLVTPEIEDTRREMLAYSKVELVEMDRDSFAKEVLIPLRRKGGRIWSRSQSEHPWWAPIDPPAENLSAESNYLLGEQPTWSDVQYIAAPRVFESALAGDALADFTVLTGTPGVGKTTTVMKVSLALRAAGREVRCVDVEDVDSYGDLLGEIRRSTEEYDLVLDNAELLGRWLPGIANEFLEAGHGRLLIVAPKRGLGGLRLSEIRTMPETVEVPVLEAEDASALIDVLTEYDMLGELEGMDRSGQVTRLSAGSGRELLVAMIWATRGEEHQARVIEEYRSLESPSRAVYGVVALARSHRYRLKQSELLMALGKDALVPLRELELAGTVVRRDGLIQPRHARIADIVVTAMRANGELRDAWVRLTQGLAVGHDIHNRHTRITRAVTRLISHDEVRSSLGLDGGRRFYADVRDQMRMDYHYWLQRGNFELDTRDGLTAGRRFLASSRAQSGGDPLVEVAWGDLLFAEAAAADPGHKAAMAEAALAHLVGLFRVSER